MTRLAVRIPPYACELTRQRESSTLRSTQFDSLARVLSGSSTRRSAVQVFASALLAGLPARHVRGKAAAGAGEPGLGAVRESSVHQSAGFIHPSWDPDRWELSLDQSFDGSDLDSEIWRTRFPWGRDRSSVGELQWYVRDDLKRTDFFQVADGRLRIVADRCVLPMEPDRAFCSGLISTHDSFSQEYGYFEIRARIPTGQGLWPAGWLLPLDASRQREIDIFEILGHAPNTVHMNVHYSGEDGEQTAMPGEFTGPDYSHGFHTFAIDWDAERIIWYVDAVERHRVSDPEAVPSGPFYLIANLAVGGDWPGHPDETTPFPAHLDIDFIRVYRRR